MEQLILFFQKIHLLFPPFTSRWCYNDVHYVVSDLFTISIYKVMDHIMKKTMHLI